MSAEGIETSEVSKFFGNLGGLMRTEDVNSLIHFHALG